MNSKTRLFLEALESRWCPALTTTLNNGTLTISGTADNGTISITQDSTTVGTITVQDGTVAASGSPFAGVTNIKLNLTSADDNVTIDLGGLALAGNVVANLGAGANTLSVLNGEIKGALAVNGAVGGPGRGGPGRHGGRGQADVVADTGADTVTLAATLTVSRLLVANGQGGGSVAVAAAVAGDVLIDAYFRSARSFATTVTVSGEVDGNVLFRGGSLADSLSVTGDVGGAVVAATGGGADTITLSGKVTGVLWLDTGAGDDTVTLRNVVGGRTAIFAGSGNDTVTVTSTAEFLANAAFSMGGGIDKVALDDSAVIASMLINGGTGVDTFTGTSTRTGLRLISF